MSATAWGKRVMSTPQIVWLIALSILGVYELWALVFGGYEMTLTAGMRDWLEKVGWLRGFLVAFLAWLAYHFAVEKKRKGRE